MTTVPPQYQQWVEQAAQALGIPVAVVAAQIDHESGFNNDSVGQYGEKGIVQFIPSTWNTWGSGDPTNLTNCLLYTSPSPRDLSTYRMPSSA